MHKMAFLIFVLFVPFVAGSTRLLACGRFRIIHSLLEGTGSRPVGFAPTFSFGARTVRRVRNGKRVDCSKGSGAS